MSDRRAQLSAASTVVSVLITGAFILETFNIPPLLDVTFNFITGEKPPQYFSIAAGAVGAYAVLFNIVYVLFVSPAQCLSDVEFPELDGNINIRAIEPMDFVNLWVVSVVYIYLAITNGIYTSTAIYAGVIVIVISQSLKVVPRLVAKRLEQTCFWAPKVVLVSLPVSLLMFLPAIAWIAWA